MTKIQAEFLINETRWLPDQIEQLAYQRNLYILHSMQDHGLAIQAANGQVLTGDDIDFLTADQAWQVSIDNRTHYTGQQISAAYQTAFEKSDAMWRALAFDPEKLMQVSHCQMHVDGMTLQQYMGIMQAMQQDERVGLTVHPEHFQSMMADDEIIGIEPFGMYGTPTFGHVKVLPEANLAPAILKDRDPEYTMAMAGEAYLLDGQTAVNIPYHQFKATATGFDAKLAVYWPENVPAEVVSGHALHLATEFYYGLQRLLEK